MGRLNLGRLRSASTVRTYPVEEEELQTAVEEAVGKMPRWSLEYSSEGEVRIIRKTGLFGFKDDVTIRLETLPSGTQADFRSASRVGMWDFGKNGRNLRKLLGVIYRELNTDGH
jgi:uncharacterized protein (DUF1499 family)